MQVTLQYAAEHLDQLASSATRGEAVEIAQPDGPNLRLSVVESVTAIARKPRKSLLGAGEGLIALPTDDEWAAMDKEIEELMLNGPIYPSESEPAESKLVESE